MPIIHIFSLGEGASPLPLSPSYGSGVPVVALQCDYNHDSYLLNMTVVAMALNSEYISACLLSYILLHLTSAYSISIDL